MKRTLILAIFAIILLLPVFSAPLVFAGHGSEKDSKAGSLVLAIHPYLPASELYNRFVPLAEYLSERLGRRVDIQIAQNYSKHIENVGQGLADIAFMGPAAYVRMAERYKPDKPLIAAIEVEGRASFRGVIIVRKESNIKDMKDLRGKSFAFGDVQSTMSHIVPRYMLIESGVPVKDLGEHRFLSNHDNVAMGVLYGKFHAGAVKMEVYDKYKSRGLKVLTYTPYIAEHIFLASHKLPAELVADIKKAFLDLNTSEKKASILTPIKSKITGLAPASYQDYDNLRKMIKALEAAGALDK